MSGHKTLLLDLDLAFGDVAISLQLIPVQSVFDAVAMSGHIDEQGVASLVTVHESSGLDVICAPNDPSDADRIPVNVVTELLKTARQHYDYVIVDTPPSFTEHVLGACDISSALILIATLDIPAVKNLRVAIDTLDMLGSPRDARVIVLNRADAKVGLRPDDVEEAVDPGRALGVGTRQAGEPQGGALDAHRRVLAGGLDDGAADLPREGARASYVGGVEGELAHQSRRSNSPRTPSWARSRSRAYAAWPGT